MKTIAISVVLLVAGMGTLYWLHHRSEGGTGTATAPLKIYCAAGMKSPVEAIATAYRAEFNIATELEYGGTASLLSGIRIGKTGDLFVAADDAAIAEARKLGLIREVVPLVRQTPVICVAKGNPKGIRALDDLLNHGVRFALANPEGASIGRVTKRALGERWGAFSSKATVLKPTVMDIAADVKLGSVDAAIVWDSTATQFPTLDTVAVPEFANAAENASVAVLAGSTQAAAALRFARYLAASEKGGPIFAAKGFKTVRSDERSGRPNSVPYSDGVTRPAVSSKDILGPDFLKTAHD